MHHTLTRQLWLQRGILLLLAFFTGALYLAAQCTADGGGITLEDGSTATTICVDGIGDPLAIVRDGNASGTNRTFFITDANSGTILAIPPNNGPFDLDGAGPGVCNIYYLAFEDDLTGLETGNNINDLAGCFDLSNPVAIDRQENIAGEITLEDGSMETTICVDDDPDPITIIRDGTATGANTTFVISDQATGAILAIPEGNGPFDLNGAGPGTCIIWYLAYSDGLQGLELGSDIGDLDGCFVLSSCVFVNREVNDGGSISLEDGSTEATICVDGIGDPLNIVRDGSATGANRTFFITDASTGTILAIPPNNGPFDLDGAGPGVCNIYYLAYGEDLTGLATGNNIADLAGCFGLSNPVSVDRQEVDGGAISLEDGSTEATICVDGIGDPLNIVRDGNATGPNRTFFITDASTGTILAIPPNNGPFDLDGAGPGVCNIYYLAHGDDFSGLATGNNIADLAGCFDLSNPVAVDRQEVDGGAISLEDGSTEATICVDGIGDPLNIVRDGNATGPNRTFFITDASTGTILAIPPNNGPFDLDGAGPGVCNIYYLAHGDDFSGLATGNNIADLAGCFDLSNPVAVDRQEVDGGAISLEDGATEATICVDGIGDPLNIVRDGNATGPNRTFFITDASTGTILAIPPNNGPFDLDGAGPGVCNIYYLAHGDDFSGLATGNNIADLAGCFDLSNPVAVDRQENSGGGISLEDGSTETSICVDGVADPLTVVRDGNAIGTNRTFIITDAATNQILAIPGDNGPFDLDGAGDGICDIWYLAYSDNLTGLMVGNNVSDLAGCFSLSNPISVNRQSPDGGMVMTTEGATTVTATAGNVMVEVSHTTTATALSYWYIITDDNNAILGFANSADTNLLDLSGAPAGTCRIWGWSYRGEGDPVLGDDISTLTDGACEAISNNFITVIRQEADCTASGGGITLADGTTAATICVDGVADPLEVVRDGNGMGANRTFVITDAMTGVILAIPDNNGPFDLDGAGGGVCDIWYLGYEDGLTGLETGNTLSDLSGCFGLSNPIVVDRQENEAGAIALEDGTTEATICVDGVADPLAIVLDGTATGANQTFFITDAATGLILAIPPGNGPFDLDGAGPGVCNIYYLAHGDDFSGLATGNNIADLSGCFDLSNPVAIDRQENNGGGITLENGATETSICVDGVADPLTVIRDGNAVGANRTFIITDAATNQILAIPGDNGPFDLDGAGDGVCDIWYLAYSDGIEGLMVGNNVSDLNGCFSLSNPISVNRQSPDGGMVMTTDGETTVTATAGDVIVEVSHTTTATALSYWYIITDDNNAILGFANSADTNVLDLSGAPAGTCRIWGWSYRGEGDPVLGDDIATLTDGACEAISDNFITVIRQDADCTASGGGITLADGATTTSICVDGVADPLEIVRDGNGMGTNRTFIITDAADGTILAIPDNNGPFDLDGAGDGTCDIWYLGYEDDLTGLMVGNNIADLSGCFGLSNPVSVIRQSPDGGMVTTTTGETTVEATAGDVIVEVSHTTTATALSYWYIITDDNNAILGFANSADTNVLDLSGAPAGTCRIWGWSYRGEGDPVLGDDIATLTDGACEAISDNFITVIRSAPVSGRLMLSEVTADGEIEIFNGTDAPIDLSSYWLCNFPAYQQLSALTLECGELELLPGEYLVVTGFTGFDAIDAELGLYSTNSFANPDAVVDYVEWGSTGHQRSSVAVAAGVWETGAFEPAPTADQSLQSVVDDEGNEVWGRSTPSPCEANDLTSSTNPVSRISTARVFPNPVSGNLLTVELEADATNDLQISMLDAQGRTIGGLLNTTLTGKGNVEVNLPDVPAGVYFLRVVNGQQLLTARFQKF